MRFSHKEFHFYFPHPTAPLSDAENVYRVGVYSYPVKIFTNTRIFVNIHSRYKNYCKSVEELFFFNSINFFFFLTFKKKTVYSQYRIIIVWYDSFNQPKV